MTLTSQGLGGVSEGQQKRRLLDQVKDRLRVLHYALRTEQAYVDWIKRFILFHGKRHPKDMGAAEVEAFLTHLAVDQGSWGQFSHRPSDKS